MKRLVLPVFIVAVVAGLSAPASADDQAKAKREYRLGYADLKAGRFADALIHYQRSYELVQRPRTLFNMALCEEQLGRDEAAFEHFTKFVAEAESRDGEFVAQAQERIARLARKLAGRVTIRSSPAGAEVRVDGAQQVRGRTPFTITLTPGEHYIQISAPGATPVERVVNIEPRKRTTLSVELELSALIVLTADPADASIRRTDEVRSTRGTYRARVEPGTYEFVVSRPGFKSETVTVQATGGGNYEQRVRLQPSLTTAKLIVRPGGSVTLDGEPTVDNPLKGMTVEAGNHVVRVEKPGARPWSETLHLSPGETVEVDIEFRSRKPAWLRWGGFAVGLAGVGAGSTLGVMALRDVTSDAADRHDRGKTRALVADGLFVVGIAAIITAWRWSSSDTSASVRRTYGGH